MGKIQKINKFKQLTFLMNYFRILIIEIILNNPSNSIICINLFLFLGFPDPLDLATGIEKKEMLLRLAGNDVSCILNYNLY